MIDGAHELPIARQAKVLNISRGCIYYKPRPVSAADLTLMRRIDELHLEYPFAGSRMLRDFLHRKGVEVGRRHVGTLMKRMGIEALYRKSNTSKPTPGNKIYPYLLRGLKVEQPNQVRAMDITYIPMARGFVYLTAVVDWFSRRVLSHRVSITMEAAFCVEALARYGKPEIFNTDQGERFKPGATTALLRCDRRWPWRFGYPVMADLDCRLIEVNGRVCVWSTAVTRRLRISEQATLAQLHAVLQVAFDWSDTPLYTLLIRGGQFGDRVRGMELAIAGGADIPLAAFSFEIGEPFRYQYHLFVLWEIDCRVKERCLISRDQCVACVGAQGYPPDEDLRGPAAYPQWFAESSPTHALCELQDLMAEEDLDPTRFREEAGGILSLTTTDLVDIERRADGLMG